ADAVQGFLVADVTSECVAGIRRIDDQPTIAGDFRRAADQSQLRIFGMKLEILAHGGASRSRDTALRWGAIIRAPPGTPGACNSSLNSLHGSSSASSTSSPGVCIPPPPHSWWPLFFRWATAGCANARS